MKRQYKKENVGMMAIEEATEQANEPPNESRRNDKQLRSIVFTIQTYLLDDTATITTFTCSFE